MCIKWLEIINNWLWTIYLCKFDHKNMVSPTPSLNNLRVFIQQSIRTSHIIKDLFELTWFYVYAKQLMQINMFLCTIISFSR
jgi:hypothetical protein